MKKWWLLAAGVVAGVAVSGGAVLAVGDSPGGPKVNQLNLHQPVTEIAAHLQSLHVMMLVICLVIFVAVFGVMFYSIWAHRKSRHPKPATFHESTAVEVAWTVVPFLIVIGMALPATKTVVAMKDTSNAEITVKATGYQWKWGYDYLTGEGQGIAFLSSLSTPIAQIRNQEPKGVNYLMEVDNPLVVPVDTKIRVITTANDVIHAWMVPSLGVKQDAIPGFVRDTWFRAEQIGEFRGQCAELCGKDHAYMPIVVRVVSKEDYSKWVQEQKQKMAALADDPTRTWTTDELKTRGQQVYASNCMACHQANGQGVPNAFPALAGSQYVVRPKAQQIGMLLNGKNAMPSFKQLSDVEIAAVMTYTRQSFGNDGKGADPVVQPADIKAAR
jgi:cytochrome c oxidase subunit 2